MNEMYLLLAVVTVLSSVFVPMFYLRIKEKQLFEALSSKFLECETNGYKTINDQERQILKEDYAALEKKNMKILYPIIIASTIITGIPILDQLIDITLLLANIYIGVVLMLFVILIMFAVFRILELRSKTFRTYKNKLLLEYVYRHIEEDIWNIIVDAIVLNLTVGIIISVCVSMFIGCTMTWPVENAYALYCVMLVVTNIIVTKEICQRQHKYLKQLIMDEAGIL